MKLPAKKSKKALKLTKPKPKKPTPEKIDEVAANYLKSKDDLGLAEARAAEARQEALTLTEQFEAVADGVRLATGSKYVLKRHDVEGKPQIDTAKLKQLLAQAKYHKFLPLFFRTKKVEIEEFDENGFVAAVENGSIPVQIAKQCAIPGRSMGSRVYVSLKDEKNES